MNLLRLKPGATHHDPLALVEATTSRPLALHGIARQTLHGNQTTVEVASTHAKASQIAEILTK